MLYIETKIVPAALAVSRELVNSRFAFVSGGFATIIFQYHPVADR